MKNWVKKWLSVILQMVFSSSLQSDILINNLRTSSVAQCASLLSNEMTNVDFRLSHSFCKSSDLGQISWISTKALDGVYSCIFPRRDVSDHNPYMMTKLDLVYQTLFYIQNKGKQPAPLQIALAQTIHTLTGSKTLLEICKKKKRDFNWLQRNAKNWYQFGAGMCWLSWRRE